MHFQLRFWKSSTQPATSQATTRTPEVTVTMPSDNTSGGSQQETTQAPPLMNNSNGVVLPGEDTKMVIKATDCAGQLGPDWPEHKKWRCLVVIFLVQVSMNFNTTLYNIVEPIAREFGRSEYEVRWGGAASFLIAYAFGCELWAPWSEEFGRKRVLQISLLLVNVFALVAGFAPNFTTHVIARTLGGLSTAGGSVTLAVITDLFHPDDHSFQYATLFIVLSSVGGSIIGAIIGGFVEGLEWRWCLWIQAMFGVAVQLLHIVVVPETRSSVIMDKIASVLRKLGTNPHLVGPSELSGRRIKWGDVYEIWTRAFKMLLTEPIVLTLSLLSGFSDSLIFMMVQSFGLVYNQWGFGSVEVGLAFIPIGLGYVIAYFSFFPVIRRNIAIRERRPRDEKAQYESRLWFLLWTAPLLPLGLFVFAFTAAFADPPVHWIGSCVGALLIGIANFAIYMATVDYVLRAYGVYAASAAGGNGWARDFLAGVLTPYAVPMYERLGVFAGTMLLFGIALAFCAAVYVVYWMGPALRRRSRFAQELVREAEETDDHFVNYLSPANASRAASRHPSAPATPAGSRRPSLQAFSMQALAPLKPDNMGNKRARFILPIRSTPRCDGAGG
ncbi:putative MFS multidrug transporter [Xylariaceae sp. FL0662B]|nr:putative MFS multidrug transporter [Xylariaceae sp. FL0662B]